LSATGRWTIEGTGAAGRTFVTHLTRTEIRMRPVLIAALALGACTSQPPAAENRAAAGNVGEIVDDASPAPVEKRPLAEAMPGPVAQASVADDSAQGAAEVVRTYYALIGAKKYGQAYALWKPGTAGMSAAAFAQSFANFQDDGAEVGAPSAIGGAAGSRYVTVPVHVRGRLASGAPFEQRGTLTLSRAVVDGASAEQRRWRISGSDFKPAPAAAMDKRSQARFRCMDGVRIMARFDPDRRRILLVRAGRTSVLAEQAGASGLRYSDGRTSFTGNGSDMRFETPGQPPIACRVIG
jgi:membrane-bound inhibitor of C-type lysozyme